MRSPQLWLCAAFAALAACPAWASDTITTGGVGSFGGDAAATQNLKGSTDDPADTVEVFHGRFRPYWRGYYHGSSGYSPRPYLYGGPIIASRFYGYRPGIGGYAYAAQYAVAAPVYAAAAPVYAVATPVYSLAPPAYCCVNPAPIPAAIGAESAAPPLAIENGYRYDGGPVASRSQPKRAAPAPKLEDAPTYNRVNTTTVKKPAYAAYGETNEPRPATLVANKSK